MEYSTEDIDSQILMHNINNDVHIALLSLETSLRKVSKENFQAQESVENTLKQLQNRFVDLSDTIEGFLNPEKDLSLNTEFARTLPVLEDVYKVKIHLQSSSDFVIHANESRLSMLFKNIVKNSYEAGAKNIFVAVSKERVMFNDDGPGFQKAILDDFKNENFIDENRKTLSLWSGLSPSILLSLRSKS